MTSWWHHTCVMLWFSSILQENTSSGGKLKEKRAPTLSVLHMYAQFSEGFFRCRITSTAKLGLYGFINNFFSGTNITGNVRTWSEIIIGCKTMFTQESIPVGCVSPVSNRVLVAATRCHYWWVCIPDQMFMGGWVLDHLPTSAMCRGVSSPSGIPNPGIPVPWTYPLGILTHSPWHTHPLC